MAMLAPPAFARQPQVLRVGAFHGVPGQFKTIQAAVDAAKPYDTILVAPGDYKTTSSRAPSTPDGNFPSGILISKPYLTLRGMNRNSVIVDGTTSGAPCNDNPADQNYGPLINGAAAGLNGVMVWKADKVSVENMTACNFLGGTGGGTGNEFWWNGGANSGTIGGWGFYGSYLNATSTFYNSSLGPKQAEIAAAQYGIFSSNWSGGTWDHTYASNMNDSGYYIGACRDQCNQTVNDAWSEYSVLGYSGSNSGGNLVIENSQFDNNKDGFDTNSQNGDNPPPQNGTCPNNGISKITHTHSCWVFMHNYVHDNNNPNVPAAGSAAAGPVGTGMSISGGRGDTVMNNRFVNNNAWGILIVPYLDNGPPCTGGTLNEPSAGQCLYDDWGEAILNNTFTHNGSYGHPTNGDIAWLNFESGHPTPCFSGNKDTSGAVTTSPSNLQSTYPTCNNKPVSANANGQLLLEALCDTQVELASGVPSPCPSGPYPRVMQINNGLHPLPPASKLPTMPNPCGGTSPSAWCSGMVIDVSKCAAKRSVSIPLAVSVGEKLKSVSVRVAGKKSSFGRHGKMVHVTIGGGAHQKIKVKITELIKVGKRKEKFNFSYVYKRC